MCKRNAIIFLYYILVLVCVFCCFTIESQPASNMSEESIALPIIMYHSILPAVRSVNDYTVTVAQFDADLAYLHNKGYQTITIADLLDYMNGGSLPDKPVMITFDDGQLNNLVYAAPILEKYGVRAVFSVVGVYVERAEREQDPNPAYAYMTWDDIHDASRSGIIEIQNHSYNLHGGSARMGFRQKSGETPAAFMDSIFSDILKMQSLLIRNSRVTPTCFTYPYGFTFKGARQLLKEAGFSSSMTCIERVNRITRDPECLFDLGRFNRSGRYSTERIMERMGIE